MDSATPIIAVKLGSYLRGIGGWPNGNGHAIYGIAATVNSDTLTMVRCQSITHAANGNHGSLNDNAIERIYGLV